MPDTIARADLRLLHAAHEFGDLPAGVRFPVADAGMLRRLADFHGRARRSPGHPAVAASYRAFVAETEAQFLALARRIEIEPWPLSRGPQPYRCSGEVLEDLRAGHVFFYTEAALPDAHPWRPRRPSGSAASGSFGTTCSARSMTPTATAFIGPGSSRPGNGKRSRRTPGCTPRPPCRPWRARR